MGFTTFPPVAKQGSPSCACCPSKLSLRRQLRYRDESRSSVGSRHRADRLRSSRSPRALPPRPFSLTGSAWQFAAAVSHRGHSPPRRPQTRAGASRPCSIVGSVAESAISGRPRSVLPGAWLARPRRVTPGWVPPPRAGCTAVRVRAVPGSPERGGPHVRTANITSKNTPKGSWLGGIPRDRERLCQDLNPQGDPRGSVPHHPASSPHRLTSG
jgi:hypothetical protein